MRTRGRGGVRLTRRGTVALAAAGGLVVALLVVVVRVVAGREDAPPVVHAPLVVREVPSAGPRIGTTRSGGRVVPAAGWVRRTARSTGVPGAAVRAYAQAALLADTGAGPSCRLRWTTLAGVGRVESVHGTFGGRTLRADGTSDRRIVGIALDGSDGVLAVPATAQGTRWHGDRRWEHAVGPMQFLPETWARYGADGDADGTQDPFDLDDAAAAAARYLCSAAAGKGGDLGSPQGWNDAVFTYNASRDYLREVAAAARAVAGAAG